MRYLQDNQKKFGVNAYASLPKPHSKKISAMESKGKCNGDVKVSAIKRYDFKYTNKNILLYKNK